jgi:NAD(P)-dependent dehydrogenase (short-subunit alcohol dehydrogenase family)
VKSFRGKVAAITGAGSGMGQAIARFLASQGCHIALSDINEPNLQQTADSLSKYDVKISIHPLDVADRAAVESFAEDVIAIMVRCTWCLTTLACLLPIQSNT